jgi:hypothetical protein
MPGDELESIDVIGRKVMMESVAANIYFSGSRTTYDEILPTVGRAEGDLGCRLLQIHPHSWRCLLYASSMRGLLVSAKSFDAMHQAAQLIAETVQCQVDRIVIYSVNCSATLSRGFDLDAVRRLCSQCRPRSNFPGAVNKSDNPKGTLVVFESGEVIITNVSTLEQARELLRHYYGQTLIHCIIE